MADGRHFQNRYVAISQRKSSDFHKILYTAADFELDERHVIKNEKVALDRLRVRQNVVFVAISGALTVGRMHPDTKLEQCSRLRLFCIIAIIIRQAC